MKKTAIFAIIAALLFTTCNDLFHESMDGNGEQKVVTLVASPPGSRYLDGNTPVYLTSDPVDADIYYYFGDDPNAVLKYTGSGISGIVSKEKPSRKLTAFAVKDGWKGSDLMIATYTLGEALLTADPANQPRYSLTIGENAIITLKMSEQIDDFTWSKTNTPKDANKEVVEVNKSVVSKTGTLNLTGRNAGTAKITVTAGEIKLTYEVEVSFMKTVGIDKLNIGERPVQDWQYKEIMGYTPNGVDWYSAIIFCNLLSDREGLSPYYTIHGQIISKEAWYSYISQNPEKINEDNTNGYRLTTIADWNQVSEEPNILYTIDWEWCWDLDGTTTNRVIREGKAKGITGKLDPKETEKTTGKNDLGFRVVRNQ